MSADKIGFDHCHVCEGEGWVEHGWDDYGHGTGNLADDGCDTCDGRGIVQVKLIVGVRHAPRHRRPWTIRRALP